MDLQYLARKFLPFMTVVQLASLLLKTKIDTQNLNIEPFLYDLMGLRYLRKKLILKKSNYLILNYFVFWKIIERKSNLNLVDQFWQLWASSVTWGLSGSSRARACLRPVEEYWGQSEIANATTGQDGYKFVYFETQFCSANISAPLDCTEIVLYSYKIKLL